MPLTSEGPRARYRAQMRDEVQAIAWEQITAAGAAALSLKAIATRLGMTAPALYRYYSSRDELLTQLILSAYDDVATSIERATVPPQSPREQLTAIALALRTWAVTNPQRYLLLYGTPVPGYHAPEESTRLAQRIFAPILAGYGAAGQSVDDPQMSAFRSSVVFWTRLHGVLSLSVAGQFDGMGVDVDALFLSEVDSLLPEVSPGGASDG